MSSAPRTALVAGLLVVLHAARAQAPDLVNVVRFSGNRSFPRRVLAEVVAVRPGRATSETALDRDAVALRRFYEAQGFFEAKVEKGIGRFGGRLVVTFTVSEGCRTKISEVVFTGNAVFSAYQLERVLPVRRGSSFSLAAIDACADVVRKQYLNAGYPFVQASGSYLRVDTAATVVIDIVEGPLCHLGDIRVRGNRTVRTGTILRALELRRGERFSQQRLYEAQRRLYATRLFQRVLFYVARSDSLKDTVALRFDVNEQPARSLALGVGFQTPPSRAVLSVDWGHDNLLNRGQTLQVGAEFSPNLGFDYRLRLDATYRIPYLILTRLDVQVHPFVFWEQLDTMRQRELGVETGMSRTLLPNLQVGLFNRLRLVADTARGITNSLALSATYDTRDDVFDPGRGFFATAGAEGAGGPLAGDNDFHRLSAEVRGFVTPLEWLVLGGRVMAARVTPYGRSRRVPYYEEYYIGGRNSLRGYPDRALGPDTVNGQAYGPFMSNSSLELRSRYILNWVGLVGFADLGVVTAGEVKPSDIACSAGAGIRVRTPIGPIRLDWGKQLRNPPAGDIGRLYFGILHAF